MATYTSYRHFTSEPLPKGFHWKNPAQLTRYNSLSAVLKEIDTTESLEAAASCIKGLQSSCIALNNYDITVYLAYFLGLLMAFGISLVIFSLRLAIIGIYFVLLSFFHIWEYTFVYLYHPETLSSESFLIDQSTKFCLAMILSLVEYSIEQVLFPGLKQRAFLIYSGFILAVFGQAIRTIAMCTAGSNFTHIIAKEKSESSTLVVTGIYSYFRHPSYFGWFLWAVSTQILLVNPISICVFSWVSWKFFRDRISYEEEQLCNMFGQKYKDYRKKVPTRIPFIP